MKTLSPQLGLTSVLGISIGAMLGSGLFVLPGLAVIQTGPSLWLAYLVAGLCVLPAALSKAELATAMPVSGGTYVYIDRTFGPLASTIGGLGLWISLLLKSAFALVGFGAYLRVLTDAPVTAVGIGLLITIVALNIIGVRKVGKMQVGVVVLAIVGLATLTVAAVGSLRTGPPESLFPHGAMGFFGTVGFVYISYAGVTKVAAIAEEIRDPDRNLPLGMLLSLGVVTALYATITYVMTRVVPAEELAGDLRPIYTMALHVSGPAVSIGAAVLGILTMTSMANAGLMAASRFPFAMSREHLVPASLAYVSRRFLTPVTSIVWTGLMMGAAIVFLDVAGIAKLASSLMILAFTAVNLCVLVLRESGVAWYKPTYHAPLYPFTQVLGTLVGVALLVMLGTAGLIAVAAVGALGCTLFVSFGRSRTDRRGVLGRLGPRRDVISEPVPTHTGAQLGEAAVVVPLVDRGAPSEALLDIAGALADGKPVEVVHLTVVPEQLTLDADVVDETLLDTLARRTRCVAHDHGMEIEFASLVTRDVARTIHAISRRVHSKWVVMQWRGRLLGSFLPFRPLGWLVEHLACNLAILKSVGTETPRAILVLAKPGPHDALIATTADQLARACGASVTFVRYVGKDASAIQRQAEMDYLEQIAKLCSGRSADSPAHPSAYRLVAGEDKVATLAHLARSYDLMILGAAPYVRFGQYLRGSFPDRLTNAAPCSVLRLQTPYEQTHASVPTAGRRSKQLELSQYLAEDCIQARLEPKNKEALFTHIANRFARAVSELQPSAIDAALWDRERTQNTSVDRGVALPHATVADAERAWLGVFTTRSPIDYNAPDGGLVDVFFVTLGPPSARATHLRILARIAQLILRTDLLDQLRAAKSDQELRAALARARPKSPVSATGL